MIERASNAYRWIFAVLAAYLLGFALFTPRTLLIVDEERYVSQAVAFARGEMNIADAGIIHPPVAHRTISNYPPGTSLLQSPFVWLAGWRGAFVLSLVALVLTTLVTARWLSEHGKDPLFSLAVPGFAGAALFGRVAMSDMPSAALVAVACWLFWRTGPRHRATSALAGLCVGVSLLFREPLAVLLAPLALGAILRRSVSIPAFLAGVSAGVAARLLLSLVLFGSATYVRDPGVSFSPSSLTHSIPMYAFILLVVFPGGALLPILYRGSKRAELVSAVVAYVALFLLYGYDSVHDSGLVRGILLGSRFMIPVLPILAWMAADVLPRARSGRYDLRPYAAAVVLMAFLIHPVARRQEEPHLALLRAIEAYATDSTPVITNSNASLKYLSPAYGERWRLILRYGLTGDSVASLSHRYGPLGVALLDRNDSEMFRAESLDNDTFLRDVGRRCEVEPAVDSTISGWTRLRISRVIACP